MSRLLTLSATYGAGGSVIAPKLAARLHLPFYDRLTHGPETRSAERIEERLTEEERSQTPPGRLAVSLSHLSGALGIPVPGAGDLDPNNELRQKVAESVWRIAETGGGVILGRGAAAVLGALSGGFPCASRRTGRATHRAGRCHRGGLPRGRPKCTSRTPTSPGRGSCNGCSTVIPATSRLYHLVIDSTAIPLDDVVDTVASAAVAFWERGIGCR